MTHRLARFLISAKEDPAVHFMPLTLARMDDDEVYGIYGAEKDEMPSRMRYLAPTAARSFRAHLAPVVQMSDMYRSAEASLRARRTRKGAQRPGYSGHNYGYSVDIAISKSMRRLKVKTKKELDLWMASKGWYCHRRDHKNAHEAWHYNYFGRQVDKWVFDKDRRTSSGLERMLVHRFGKWWTKMSDTDAQRCLTRLGMYDGDIDGIVGPITKEATRVFQRAWLIGPTGSLNAMTRRTLAFVTADRVVV